MSLFKGFVGWFNFYFEDGFNGEFWHDLQVSFVVGLGAGIVMGLVAGIVAGLGAGLGVGLGAGLVTGLVAGISVGVGAGISVGVGAGLVTGLVAGIVAGLGAGLVAGVVAGLLEACRVVPFSLELLIIFLVLTELFFWFSKSKPEKNESRFVFTLKKKLLFFVLSFYTVFQLIGIYLAGQKIVNWVNQNFNYIKEWLGYFGFIVIGLLVFIFWIWVNSLKYKSVSKSREKQNKNKKEGVVR